MTSGVRRRTPLPRRVAAAGIVVGFVAMSLVYPPPPPAASAGDSCLLVGTLAATGWLSATDLTDTDPATNETVVGTTGMNDLGPLAIQPSTGLVYAARPDRIGTIDPSTGTYTNLGGGLGSADGALGTVSIDALAGLAFDPATGDLWAVHRMPTPRDLLLRLDPAGGDIIRDTFGPGLDYAELTSNKASVQDFLGLAFDAGGVLYSIGFDGSSSYLLHVVDPSTGAATAPSGAGPPATVDLAVDSENRLWGIGPTGELHELNGVAPTRTVDDLAAYSGIACKPIPLNQSPVFDQDLPDRTDLEGSTVNLPSPATDPDGDGLIYGAAGLPSGLSIDPASGLISGTLAPDTHGSHPVTVTVTDDGTPARTTEDAFTWTVEGRSPLRGTVVVNEVMFRGTSGAGNNDEFVELTNTGASPVDLAGFRIVSGAGGLDHIISPGAVVPPGGHAVVWMGPNGAKQQAPEAAFQEWLGASDLLANPTDDIRLRDPDGLLVDFVRWGDGTGLASMPPAAVWDGAFGTALTTSPGQSLSLTPTGADSDSSACWEPTTSGVASGSCPGALLTLDAPVGAEKHSAGVANTDRPPIFDQDLGDRVDPEGAAVVISAAATDPEGGPVGYSASGLPDGISVDPVTGVISGTISFSAAASSPQSVTITATDDKGGIAVDTFIWEITDTNRPPGVAAPSDRNLAEGDVLLVGVATVDLDGDPIGVTVTGLPAWASYSELTAIPGSTLGAISGTPGYSDAGTSLVTITANDGSLSTDATFTITVTNTNRPPLVTNPGAQTTPELAPFSVTITAVDPDGDPVGLSAVGVPAWAGFVDNGNGTATISGTPGASSSGTDTVTVTATDGVLADAVTFDITVTNTNLPPVLVDPGDQTAFEGTGFTLAMTASDPDGTRPTFTASGLPAWALLVDAGDGTASLTGTPGYTDAGSTPITVTVTDGILTDAVTFSVTVVDVDRSPLLDPIADISTEEGAPVAVSIAATDPDGDPITISATGLPAWAALTDNGDGTADITGTPGFSDAGAATVTVTASAGSGSASAGFTLLVLDTDRPAVWTPVPDQAVAEGAAFSLTVTASDPDGTIPPLSATSLPGWATFTDNADGTGTFVGTPGYDAAGTSTVQLSAASGTLVTLETFNLTVTNTNRSPGLVTPGPQAAAEGSSFSITITATDPDDDPLGLLVSGLPAWATSSSVPAPVGAAIVTISGTPGYSAAGTSTVTLTATDGVATVSVNFALVVVNTNRPPALTLPTVRTVAEGALLSATVSTSDADGTIPVLSASGLPVWASFLDHRDGTGTISGTPGYSAAGTSTVTISAGDGEATTTAGFTLTVTNTNRVPVVSAPPSALGYEGAPLSVTVNGSDPDADPLTWSATGLPGWASILELPDGNAALYGTPGYSDAATYTVTITADDAMATAAVSVDITIIETNRPPVIDYDGPATIVAGDTWLAGVTATDPDGPLPDVTVLDLPSWATFTARPGGGTLNGAPASSDVGTSTVRVRASDGMLTVEDEFEVTVMMPDRPPTIEWSAASSAAEGAQIDPIVIYVTDPDGDPVTISAANLPVWAEFVRTPGGGMISGTPGYDDGGTTTVVISAVARGVTVTESISLSIANTNRPPVARDLSVVTEEGRAIDISLASAVGDPDGDPLTLTVAGAQSHGTASGVATTIRYVPDPGFTGHDMVEYTIADLSGARASATVTIEIRPSNFAALVSKSGSGTLVESMGTATNPAGTTDSRSLSPTEGLRVAFSAAAETIQSQILPTLVLGIVMAWLLVLGVGRREDEEETGLG